MDGWIIFFLHNQSFLCFLKSGSSFCVFLFHSRFLQLVKENSFQTENCWLDSYNSESKSTEKATCVCGSYYTINRPIAKKKKKGPFFQKLPIRNNLSYVSVIVVNSESWPAKSGHCTVLQLFHLFFNSLKKYILFLNTSTTKWILSTYCFILVLWLRASLDLWNKHWKRWRPPMRGRGDDRCCLLWQAVFLHCSNRVYWALL